jgi:catechol-2,3-dioxygenase
MYRPKPRKLGHIVLLVRDIHASVKFYEDVVGLTVSDWISDRMVFMRAGEDHHDMALAQLPPDAPERQPGTPGLEHFSYKLDSYEEIEQTVEMLKQRGVTIDRGPGKHGPGENCFIVFKDPDGNNVEFYCDMRQVTADNPYDASVWNDDIDSFDQWRLEKFAVPPPARFKNLKKS